MTQGRHKPITIVGGGIAGLTLGILLRREGIPVKLFEAGALPRHKVCGEFVSGRGIQILGELGITPRLFSEGAREAKTIQFFTQNTRSTRLDLPEKALCISRYQFDLALADKFRERGGELRSKEGAFEGNGSAGIVVASGRRLCREQGTTLFWGLKVHARRLEIDADLEMHFTPDAYVGLNRIEADRVNICGLFRSRKPLLNLRRHWLQRLVSCLHIENRAGIQTADFDLDSLSFVSGLGYEATKNRTTNLLSIGDAAGLIPPITGNGISKALESATLAVGPLVDYSKGNREWTQACGLAKRKHQRRFARRLFWARLTQRLLFANWIGPLRPSAVRFASLFYRQIYAVTR